MSTIKVNTIQSNTTAGVDVNSPLESIPSIDVTGSATIGGGINVTGVVTATGFVGDGSSLTGIAATDNVRTSSLVVSGVSTISQLAGVGIGTSIQVSSGSKIVGLSTGSIVYPGAILQVIQVVKSDTFSVSPGANTFGTVTGLGATITPTSSSSKILVTLDMYVGQSAYQVGIRLFRNGTHIGAATSEGSRTAATFYHNSYDAVGYSCIRAGGMYLDSPASTSSLSYTVGIKDYSVYTAYVNRSHAYQNTSDFDHNTISTITLMEVSG